MQLMRIIYIDEKDLHLYIEKESFRIKYKKWSYGVLGGRNNIHIKDTDGE